MLFDSKHRPWAAVTGALLAVVLAIYAVGRQAPNGASGGSRAGLVLGIAATLMMAFAFRIAINRKRAALRRFDAQWWLRGHLWIGGLAGVTAWLHAGCRFGGPLEQWLMIALGLVLVTGLYGVTAQNQIPRWMKSSLDRETFAGQIPYLIDRNRILCDRLVAAECKAPLPLSDDELQPTFKKLLDRAATAGADDWLEEIDPGTHPLLKSLARYAKDNAWEGMHRAHSLGKALACIYSNEEAPAPGENAASEVAPANDAAETAGPVSAPPKKLSPVEQTATAEISTSAPAKTLTPIEQMRARSKAAAAAAPPVPTDAVEAGAATASVEASPVSPPAKKLSPIEQVRARAKAAAANAAPAPADGGEAGTAIPSGEAATAVSPPPKKLSPIEQIRARAKAAQAATAEAAPAPAGAPETNPPSVSVESPPVESDPPKKLSPIEQIRARAKAAQAAAESSSPVPAAAAETHPAGASAETPAPVSAAARKLSPVEQIRARAKVVQELPPPTATAEVSPGASAMSARKPSPLDQLKAARAKAAESPASKPPTPSAASRIVPPTQLLQRPKAAEIPARELSALRDFYLNTVRPVLRQKPPRRHPLLFEESAMREFRRVQSQLVPELHPVLKQLQSFCEDRRQMRENVRLRRWLYWWLAVHVPASVAVVALLLVHVVMALRVIPLPQ